MCGITGFLGPKVESPKELLKNMCDLIRHRGPDDEGLLVREGLGLGMRRLSIIDVEGGAQPIWNEDKSICIVFNGEIYNFPSLARELESCGHRLKTHCDTEVIVHAYEEWGEAVVEHLNGMFAFALYDFNSQRLFLARDRLGIKPLYYYWRNGVFVFGSELRSIRLHPAVDSNLDLLAMRDFLFLDSVPTPRSILSNISKLPQGHTLTLQNGRMDIQAYWKPGFLPKHQGTFSRQKEELESLIDAAVKRRLISDVPLGAFLSGGVDSSVVVAMMKRHEADVKTFSIAFEDPSFDESSHAKIVADHLGTHHHEWVLGDQDLIGLVEEIVGHFDEPLGDSSIIPTFMLSRLVRSEVTVALSGDGGDELFAGYPTYQAHRIAGLVPDILAPALRWGASQLPASDNNFGLAFKAQKFASGLAYPPLIRNRIWMGSFGPKEMDGLFLPEVEQAINGGNMLSPLNRFTEGMTFDGGLDPLLAQDMDAYLQSQVLVKVDRMSMANSLEVRVPLLDHTVVDFVCRLPEHRKLKGLTSKYIFKKLAEPLLPKSIPGRKKKGFGMPVAAWAKGPLKELFHDYLSEAFIRRQGLFSPEKIESIWRRHQEGRADMRKLLWTLFVFQYWHENSLNC